MTTKTTTLHLLATGLVLLALAVGTPSTALAAMDGSKPLLCAVTTVMECDVEGKCQRITPEQHPDFPAFLKLDVPQKTITPGGTPAGSPPGTTAGRKTEIKAVSHVDGRLVLHGGENGRGWAATVAEDTGRMSAGIVTDEFAFNLFGTCTES
jgi:hypothetical protein